MKNGLTDFIKNITSLVNDISANLVVEFTEKERIQSIVDKHRKQLEDTFNLFLLNKFSQVYIQRIANIYYIRLVKLENLTYENLQINKVGQETGYNSEILLYIVNVIEDLLKNALLETGRLLDSSLPAPLYSVMATSDVFTEVFQKLQQGSRWKKLPAQLNQLFENFYLNFGSASSCPPSYWQLNFAIKFLDKLVIQSESNTKDLTERITKLIITQNLNTESSLQYLKYHMYEAYIKDKNLSEKINGLTEALKEIKSIQTSKHLYYEKDFVTVKAFYENLLSEELNYTEKLINDVNFERQNSITVATSLEEMNIWAITNRNRIDNTDLNQVLEVMKKFIVNPQINNEINYQPSWNLKDMDIAMVARYCENLKNQLDQIYSNFPELDPG